MPRAEVKVAVATTAVTRKAAALTIKTTRLVGAKEVPLARVETRKATALRPSN